ncbi:hypothetical protein [Rhizobium binxianense]|uniref:hypothetical protein n=1 Tax=Rhizobium binxianense TaxID=3024242 RepID=UPI00235E5D2C|nr:hypothetical protein [Rhizobium sp. MJ37]
MSAIITRGARHWNRPDVGRSPEKCSGKCRWKLKVRQENYELSALNIRTLISSAAGPLDCRGVSPFISITLLKILLTSTSIPSISPVFSAEELKRLKSCRTPDIHETKDLRVEAV